jgi:hypothetical protein
MSHYQIRLPECDVEARQTKLSETMQLKRNYKNKYFLNKTIQKYILTHQDVQSFRTRVL